MVAKTRSAHATCGVAVGVGVGVAEGLAEGRGEGVAAGPQPEPATTISKRIATNRRRGIEDRTETSPIGLLRITHRSELHASVEYGARAGWERFGVGPGLRDRPPWGGGLGEREGK